MNDNAAHGTRLHVLILQHPQEPGEARGSAGLLHELVPNSTLRVGLSWPNLSKALGHEATPSEWVVLYLQGTRPITPDDRVLWFVSKKKELVLDDSSIREKLKGIIVLDGTWSQAKTLWWRNAWLLKARRAFLVPKSPSLYGRLRKEPRPECVSTLESAALALEALGEAPELRTYLESEFKSRVKELTSRTATR